MLVALKKLTVLGLAAMLVTSLAGCGRKGGLETPGTYDVKPDGSVVKKTASPVEDKPFILDPLL